MTAKKLSTLSQDFIDAYGNTARNVIQAYRASGERVAGFVEQRWEQAMEQTRGQLVAEVHDNARHAQKVIGGYYARGLAFTTEGADAVVNQLVTLAGQGLQQVAANASRFEEKTGLTLDRLSLVATPVAAAAVKLVGQIEQKSGELASKIAGDSVLPKRTSAFRKAKKK